MCTLFTGHISVRFWYKFSCCKYLGQGRQQTKSDGQKYPFWSKNGFNDLKNWFKLHPTSMKFKKNMYFNNIHQCTKKYENPMRRFKIAAK